MRIMAKSMTGFGRGEFLSEEKQISVEIKTVNHRFLDISLKMPRVLKCIEEKIRKLVQGRLARGKIDIYITYTELQKAGCNVCIDEGLAEAYIRTLRSAAEKYQLSANIYATDLLRLPDVINLVGAEMDEEAVWADLSAAIERALDSLLEMRKSEGARLTENLLEMADHIEELMKVVRERAPAVPLEYKEKLQARLETLLSSDAVDPQRLAQEVAFYADKCSVDEEITRMDSHIEQFRSILQTEEAVGRKLDFLVQEMNREANTTGSKANDITLTRSVIAIKSEIEKIREQIQNLE